MKRERSSVQAWWEVPHMGLFAVLEKMEEYLCMQQKIEVEPSHDQRQRFKVFRGRDLHSTRKKSILSRMPQTLQSCSCSRPSASSSAFPTLPSRTPAQQQSVAPSPAAPKALPGSPSLTKQPKCLLISSS